MPRYLTKSRFALAVECETQLFYTGKAEYTDHKKDDPFLSVLAEGGFQVGEMAKLYFPGGHEIETLEHEQALKQTLKLLEQRSVILYEAAVRYRNLFIRADILINNGSKPDLIGYYIDEVYGKDPEKIEFEFYSVMVARMAYEYFLKSSWWSVFAQGGWQQVHFELNEKSTL